jgi:hypothetical protein
MHLAKSNRNTKSGRKPNGFSVLEMILASAVLMVGVISVVQLVPASLNSSIGNRLDTVATVVAQRELDQMLRQPLNVTTFVDNDQQTIRLGGAGAPGAPVAMSGGYAAIQFAASLPPTGFYKFYTDLNDPTQPAPNFDLRWAVFPQLNNGVVVGRRIIIGCRRTNDGGNQQLLLPVNLDSSVQK